MSGLMRQLYLLFSFSSEPPNVTVTPEHLITNNTDPYELSCEATGIPPPSITWRLNQSPDPLQNISGVLSILSSYETLVSGIFRTTSVINIVSASKTFEGNFTCKGENTANNVIGSIEERQVFVFIQGVCVQSKSRNTGSNQ